ncbi:M60 family metallopeptidase [Candidatus Ozemobacteraceae bacterium]|nr:M60 family metallopeptidase [Candidatus Ozemobacteraceae bacterium]
MTDSLELPVSRPAFMHGHTSRRFVAALAIVVFALTLPSRATPLAQEDLARLTAGVRQIAKTGVPGPVACVGEEAFPVVLGKAKGYDQPVVAATRFGNGRVVAFGHGGILNEEGLKQGDTKRFVANAAQWAARTPTPGNVKPVAGLIFALDISRLLKEAGFEVKFLRCPGWKDQLAGIDLLVGDNIAVDEEHEKALTAFIREGGGYLATGLAWGWMQVYPRLDYTKDYSLNRVLTPMGLAFVDGYIDEIPPLKAGDLAWLRRGHALDALTLLETRRSAGQNESAEQALAVVSSAYRWLPQGTSPFRDRVHALVEKTARPVVPTDKQPIRTSDPLPRLALLTDQFDSLLNMTSDMRPAESAADFPGAPPEDAPRVTREIDVDLSVPGWTSTGLWALAGKAVEITLPKSCSGDGFRIRIGCHTDVLWNNPEWKRHPEIARSFPAMAGLNRVANPHGGLLYLDIPRSPDGMDPGHAKMRVGGGVVEAPFYVLGKTGAVEWKRLRDAPAPWAELQCDRIVLTMPSAEIRSLDDPKPLMEFWHKVLGWYVDLGARPLDRRPQRIVTDRQISNGWLHAGYPIMGNIAVSYKLVKLEGLTNPEKDVEGAWGFWHELGHNHQRPEWTFAGAGEVTCNLFSLFVEEKIRGIHPKDHPWMSSHRESVRAYLSHPDYEVWKKSPGIGLCFFANLQAVFGWEPFKKIFAGYAAAPDHELPKTDEAKRDQWLVRLSHATGKNLAPEFDRWGIPVSATARKEVARLPSWRSPD